VAAVEPAAVVAPAVAARAARRNAARDRRPPRRGRAVPPPIDVEPAPDVAMEPEPEPEPAPRRGRRVPPTTDSLGRPRKRAGASMRRTPPDRRGAPAQPVTLPAVVVEPDVAPAEPGWLVVGDLRMHTATGEVWSGTHEVHLTAAELAVLELLMTNGDKGVTTEAIIAAAQLDESSPEWNDPDAILTQLRRKTRVRGNAQSVRKERVLLYFFGDEDDDSTT
jgi:hypothetical protein